MFVINSVYNITPSFTAERMSKWICQKQMKGDELCMQDMT